MVPSLSDGETLWIGMNSSSGVATSTTVGAFARVGAAVGMAASEFEVGSGGTAYLVELRCSKVAVLARLNEDRTVSAKVGSSAGTSVPRVTVMGSLFALSQNRVSSYSGVATVKLSCHSYIP